MTVSHRIYTLIFSTAIGLAGLAALSIFQMSQVYTETNFTNVNTIPKLIDLGTAYKSFAQMRVQLLLNVVAKDAAERAGLERKMNEERAKIDAALSKYEKGDITDAQDRTLLEDDRKALAAYDVVRQEMTALTRADKATEALDLLMAKPVAGPVRAAMEAHEQYNVDVGLRKATNAMAIMNQARWLMGVIAFMVLGTVIGIGAFFRRSLLRQLGCEPSHLTDIAGKISSGDLATQIDVKSCDQSSLLFSVRSMRDSLAAIVGQVRAGTDAIAAASTEIADGNLDLSSRTEHQASSLEETASSMEELIGTVRQNADNAGQANQLARSASEFAVQGGRVVSQVVDTMAAINESSRKIVDIISVIDGIAFQTNILALNAAVEAARAGEQGRGFAVVAAEVRNLAQRSAAAAKEIKELISNSVEKVDAGSKLVDQAGSTMDEVVTSVKRVSDIINEIASASYEQTSGIEQVNVAVTEMDSVTQQNAALVEEAAAAAGFLQEQAAALTQVVSLFKLDDSAPVARPAPAPVPARAVAVMGNATAFVANGASRTKLGNKLYLPRSNINDRSDLDRIGVES
jgi:methyl-accepting chemotaxis protein